MTKQPYTSPKIYRVELNHDQAVLSMCSTLNTDLRDEMQFGCNPQKNCRQYKDFRDADFNAGS